MLVFLIAATPRADDGSLILTPEILQSFGVALITFIMAPIILFFLNWIKDYAQSREVRTRKLQTQVETIVESQLNSIIESRIKPYFDEIKTEFREVKLDIRRLEDINLNNNRRNRD